MSHQATFNGTRRSWQSLFLSCLAVAIRSPSSHLVSFAQKNPNAGYYFAYTSAAGPDGRVKANRVSNAYYSELDWLTMTKRVRAILNGFQGSIGLKGPYKTAAEAQNHLNAGYKGLPTLQVLDTLR